MKEKKEKRKKVKPTHGPEENTAEKSKYASNLVCAHTYMHINKCIVSLFKI